MGYPSKLAAICKTTQKTLLNYPLLLLTLPAIIVTFAGCCTYGEKQPVEYEKLPSYSLHNAAANPMLIFDNPTGKISKASLIDSEQFGRYEWPVSEYPQGYLDAPEIITYREYYSSDQYINNNNRAQVHFNRRLAGYRAGYKYR